MPRKILLLGWLALLALQLYFLWYVISYLQWSGPVQDFWGSIPFIEKTLQSGNWLGADLWIAQNNHRIVLPRLAFLVDYAYFDGSNFFLTGLSVLFLLAEIGLLCFLLAGRQTPQGTSWVYFPVIAILLLPAVAYNFLNTFNIQWIQCACLALSACAAYSYGLGTNRNTWTSTGIILAILCSFTTFSLPAIWPALFLLLWLHHAPPKQWLVLGFIFVGFVIIFVFLLPVDRTLGNGSYYKLPLLFEKMAESDLPVTTIMSVAGSLLAYLVIYLSYPLAKNVQAASYLITVISLLWWGLSLLRSRRHPMTWQGSALYAAMFFAICLGLSTGLGRAFAGDLAYGIRFTPIVLLYWAACLAHVFSQGAWLQARRYGGMVNILGLFILSAITLYSADKTGARLAEEHNRYGRMQMAYLTGNRHPNALYENLVPEWRAIVYPGIFAVIPYLKENRLGIFHQDIGTFLQDKPLPLAGETCLSLTLVEKPRNQDIDIRNITFRHPDPAQQGLYPYLLLYSGADVIGAAFRQGYAPFEQVQKSVWIGISSKPLPHAETAGVIALAPGGACRVEVQRSNDNKNID